MRKVEVRWSAHDEDDHHIYAFEVRDANHKERLAWVFVIEREGALEIEELYVRPEYRRLYGRWLADRVLQLAHEKGLPLRLWIAFADCRTETKQLASVLATARRIGIRFQRPQVPWAAYFGTTDQPGEDVPVEPVTIPGRPRCPQAALLAAVAALGLGSSQPAVNGVQAIPADQRLQDEAITVGTREWDMLTARRAELIYKKNRQGLTETEAAEYERLQRLSRASIARAFSSPTSAELADVERALAAA